VLGNINTLIALRLLDAETQQYVTDSLPRCGCAASPALRAAPPARPNPLLYSGSVREQLAEEAGELFPPALLGQLPNLHYLARLAGGRVVKGRLPILVRPEPMTTNATRRRRARRQLSNPVRLPPAARGP